MEEGDEHEMLDYTVEAEGGDAGLTGADEQQGAASDAQDAAMQDSQPPEHGDGDLAADPATPGGEQQQGGSGARGAAAAVDPLSLPPHGTEVFISRLPREATEEQLRAFCARAGEVHALRVPPPAPGGAPALHNKGFMFCVYLTREAADQALSALHQQELPDFPGHKVSVVRSDVKNRLFVGGVPRDLSRDALLALLEAEAKGLEHLELVMDHEPGRNKGFAFAEFYNFAAAEAARRTLSRPGFKVHGRAVTVTWADPKRNEGGAPGPQQQQQEEVRAVHVSGLPTAGGVEGVDEAALEKLFEGYGKVTHVSLLRQPDDPSRLRGFAFVHFEERAHALQAAGDAASGAAKFELEGCQLKVHMARPTGPRNDAHEHDPGGRPGGAQGGSRAYYTGGGGGGGRAPTSLAGGGLGRSGGGAHDRGPPPRGPPLRGGGGGGYDDGRGPPMVPFVYPGGGLPGGPFPPGMVVMMPGGQMAYVMASPPPGMAPPRHHRDGGGPPGPRFEGREGREPPPRERDGRDGGGGGGGGGSAAGPMRRAPIVSSQVAGRGQGGRDDGRGGGGGGGGYVPRGFGAGVAAASSSGGGGNTAASAGAKRYAPY